MRAGLAIALVLLGAAPAAALAPASPRPASVKLTDCSREASSAAFYARMRGIEGSERMWMRFTLLEKQLGRYRRVVAPGLSRWRRSRPGVSAFGYRQEVRGLKRGGLYRMRVRFRWYSGDGELVERTRRLSAACRQFDALPDLASSVVRAERTKAAGVLRYLMRVSNSGVAPAAQVALRLSVDGSAVDTVTVASLAPGEQREVALRGPDCTSSVESMVDPEGVIVEASEADNKHELRCAELPRP